MKVWAATFRHLAGAIADDDLIARMLPVTDVLGHPTVTVAEVFHLARVPPVGQQSRRPSPTRREGKIPANCLAGRVIDVERLASPRQRGVE